MLYLIVLLLLNGHRKPMHVHVQVSEIHTPQLARALHTFVVTYCGVHNCTEEKQWIMLPPDASCSWRQERQKTRTWTSPDGVPQKGKRRALRGESRKRAQVVGTGGSETHTLDEWAATTGNPPAAGGRGIRRVDPRGALLPQSLSAPTFATHQGLFWVFF